MPTKLKGAGLLMVWADVPADKEPEFNRWYNEEHLKERSRAGRSTSPATSWKTPP
jgi:hypothetical protein